MVVRETPSLVPMADPRSPAAAASSVEPLSVDVGDSAGADRRLSAECEPETYEVKQGGTRLSSQNLAVLTTGLKIVTSLRGHFNVSAAPGKLKASVDGGSTLSSSLSRRSEDDDGYCSRSSLDSPVQINRPDAAPVSPTTTTTTLDSPIDSFPPAEDSDSTPLVHKVQTACMQVL